MNLKITYHKKDFEPETKLQKGEARPLVYETFDSYESFYAQVYQSLFQSLFGYGMQICGNRDLVKDCIQELFSELWKNKKILIKIKDVKPYLLKSLKRKIIRELKQEKRLSLENGFELEISPELKLIRDQETIKNSQDLKLALQSLTHRQREAIYLKFYSNLSYNEIAEILEIKTKATYKLVARALTTLKEVISNSL